MATLPTAPLIDTLGSALTEQQQGRVSCGWQDGTPAPSARGAQPRRHPPRNNSILCLSHLVANSPFNLSDRSDLFSIYGAPHRSHLMPLTLAGAMRPILLPRQAHFSISSHPS